VRDLDKKKVGYVALCLWIIVLVAVAAYGVWNVAVTMPSHGNLVAYGMTPNPSVLYWGNVTIGETYSDPVNLTNTGTQPLTNLTMWTSNVNGPAGFNFTLTWSKEGATIMPTQTLVATFSLVVYGPTPSQGQPSPFSFDINVKGL
jgi:hypothetical protein